MNSITGSLLMVLPKKNSLLIEINSLMDPLLTGVYDKLLWNFFLRRINFTSVGT